MKKFFSTAAVLLPLLASATPLTPEQALERLAGSSAMTKAPGNARINPSPVLTEYNSGKPALYIFNRADSNGFVILSADDCAAPLLGYGDNCAISSDRTDLPEGFIYWINTLSSRIVTAAEAGANTTAYVSATRPDRAPISPLCTTRWDQGTPFNNDCPLDGTQRSVTGCAATALSQVMKYHNWPESGEGSVSYQWKGQTLSEKFDTVTFAWNNMIDTYTEGSYTPAEAAAVAGLMKSAGYALEMDYSASASSAFTNMPAPALGNYFRYDKGMRSVRREFYALPDWEELIYNSLSTYGPVIYNGQSSGGGHSFICDGYSQDGYFHINWGWGGMSDGYFLLDALDPDNQGTGGSSTGAGFDFDQDALIDIRPDRSGTSEWIPYMASSDPFSINKTDCSAGETILIGGGFFNYSSVNIPEGSQITLAFIPSGSEEPVYDPNTFTLPELAPNHGYNGIYIKLPSDLPSGDYTMYPVYRLPGGEWQRILVPVGKTRDFIVRVDDTAITINPVAGAAPVFTVSAITPIYAGYPFRITTSVTNESSTPYYGKIVAILYTKEGDLYSSASPFALSLDGGETRELNYETSLKYLYNGQSTITPGDYDLCLAEQSGNSFTPLTEKLPVTINAAETPSLSVSDLTIEDGQSKNALTATAKVACTKGYYAGNIRFLIFPANGGSALHSANSPMLTLSAGESQNVSITTNFSAGEENASYLGAIFVGNSQATNPIRFTLGSTSTGIESITTHQAPARYYDLHGIEVMSPTPGQILIRRQGTTATKIIF